MNVTWPRFLPLYLYHPTIHSSLFVLSLDPSQRNNKSNQMSKDGPSVSLTCIGSRVPMHVAWDAFKKKKKSLTRNVRINAVLATSATVPSRDVSHNGDQPNTKREKWGVQSYCKIFIPDFFFLEGLFFFFSPILQSRHQNCLCARRRCRKALLVKILVCAAGWPHTPAGCQSRSSKRPFGYRASSSVLLQMG